MFTLLAGEPVLPGTESCFFTAGGVDDIFWNGLTGCTGAVREPIERGKVWLLDKVALAGRLPAIVNFLPEARTNTKGMTCDLYIKH